MTILNSGRKENFLPHYYGIGEPGRVPGTNSPRKEVIQLLLPEQLPCYDLVLIAEFTLGPDITSETLDTPNSPRLTGSVYKRRERIHRGLLTRDYYQFRLHVGEFQPTI